MKNEEKQKEKSITVKKDKKKPEDLLQGKFRHFTGDIKVDDDKKKRLSSTAKSNIRPFSDSNIKTHRF